jgi:hypothetical protein
MTKMKLNDMPVELRSETMCINRMKTAINTGTLEQMHEVLALIPNDILITAFVHTHINELRAIKPGKEEDASLATMPIQARTEKLCIQAMRTAIKLDGLTGCKEMTNVLEFIPKEMLIAAFVRANIHEFVGDCAPPIGH